MEPTTSSTAANEMTLKDSIAQVLPLVPAPIREFLTGPERDKTISTISAKYKLRIDQAGVFESQLIVMMLGLIAPEAFTAALATAAISTEVIEGIVGDLNEQVFKPLQAKMPQEGSAPMGTTPTTTPAPAAEKPHMATPMEEKTLNRLAPQGSVATTPTTPAATMTPAPAAVVPRPAPQPPANLPGVIQPQAPIAKPAITLGGSFAMPTPQQSAPLSTAPAPVAPPPAPAPMPVSRPAPSAMSAPAAAPKPVVATPFNTPITKTYTIDPYRELPDEEEK